MNLKLDMSKTYDRVEWGCLESIMVKMSFHTKWVDIMMRYVQTVTYSIKIIGKPRGNITLTRGLRQGDPLSPSLFLICAEGLLELLKKLIELGTLKGVATCVREPDISHLLFVDDSLILCWATEEECSTLIAILEEYEQASGQQLN